ncbi:MAG: hypothetical protein GY910_19950 [bacterium]|nr:hypothetical protein [bacterium]
MRAGPIQTGDLYGLESWTNDIARADVHLADLSPRVCAELDLRGRSIERPDRLRLAIPGGVATYHEEYEVAKIEVVDRGGTARGSDLIFETKRIPRKQIPSNGLEVLMLGRYPPAYRRDQARWRGP